MKRSSSSTEFKDSRSLKRANSSLFSIATLVDDDHHLLVNSNSANSLTHNNVVRPINDQISNLLVVDDVVSTEDGGALCIDSDDSCSGLNLQHENDQDAKLQLHPNEIRKSDSKALSSSKDINNAESLASSSLKNLPVPYLCGGDFGEEPPPSEDGILSSCSSSEIDANETLDVQTTDEIIQENRNAATNRKVSWGDIDENIAVKMQMNQGDKISSYINHKDEAPSPISLCLPCGKASNLKTENANSKLLPMDKHKQTALLSPKEMSVPEDQSSGEFSDVATTTTKATASTINSEKAFPRIPGFHRTGLVFESGSKHFDRHNRFHKERPLRVTSIRDYLLKSKPGADGNDMAMVERCHLLGSCEGEECETGDDESGISPEEEFLDNDDYLRVHLPGYMQRLDRITKCNCMERLDTEAEQFKSIYFTNDSVREAKAAAASLCRLVSNVVSGHLDNGFAVIRPPGHHAEPGLAGGYCVINNVAVSAAYAREKLGVKKVLIVDWDVHHGNGTQRCFIDDPNVLYFSVHRYHGGNFFPFLDGGGPTSVGNNQGKGFNINVGWNDKKMGDDEYLVVWEKLLMPIANEFNPDLVLVSAGFDAARGDMGECDVTPECFARLTRRLKTLADGKVVCALEGGYVRSVLCKCVENVLLSLLDSNSDDKCKEELQTFYKNIGDLEMLDCIDPSATKSIQETIEAHSPYWKCLQQH